MNTLRNIRCVATVAAVLGLSVLTLSPAHAGDESRRGPPGSFEALMSTKLPGMYGPRLAVSPVGPDQHPAVPGSAAALARAKTPSLFPTSATDAGPICPNADRYAPGSFGAIMNAKLPGSFGPRTCLAQNR